MTEYLYDKENPKSRLRYKPQGWESFYRGMPNNFERAELIGRRLMKDYDGDLSKFSLNPKKPYDPAQRWRTLKNITRFLKNPIGYTVWRYYYAKNIGNAPSFWYLSVGVMVYFIVEQIGAKQKFMNASLEIYRWNRGQKDFVPHRGWDDKRLVVGPDTTIYKKKMANFNSINKNPNARCATTAYWCRDQNFRKYFEMRKKNGIAPSVNVNTYYNKEKAKAYYDGLLEGEFMFDKIENIQ